MSITLTPGIACKCSCRVYNGDDGKKYWFDYRKNTVYSTDCHKKDPIKAIGTFIIRIEKRLKNVISTSSQIIKQ